MRTREPNGHGDGPMSLDLLLEAVPVVLTGLKLTLVVTVASFLIGQVLALPIALAIVSPNRFLSLPAWLYTFVLRGSPLLVQLFIIYYGLGQLEAVRDSVFWPIVREPLSCAIIAIGLNSAAYVAEILAGAIRRLPVGQVEACRALGLSRWRTLKEVVLPQVYRAIFPLIGNELILVLKGSSLASAVTVMEMTGAARAFTAKTYAPFEVFIVAGLVYLAVGFLASLAFDAIERRFLSRSGASGRPGRAAVSRAMS